MSPLFRFPACKVSCNNQSVETPLAAFPGTNESDNACNRRIHDAKNSWRPTLFARIRDLERTPLRRPQNAFEIVV